MAVATQTYKQEKKALNITRFIYDILTTFRARPRPVAAMRHWGYGVQVPSFYPSP